MIYRKSPCHHGLLLMASAAMMVTGCSSDDAASVGEYILADGAEITIDAKEAAPLLSNQSIAHMSGVHLSSVLSKPTTLGFGEMDAETGEGSVTVTYGDEGEEVQAEFEVVLGSIKWEACTGDTNVCNSLLGTQSEYNISCHNNIVYEVNGQDEISCTATGGGLVNSDGLTINRRSDYISNCGTETCSISVTFTDSQGNSFTRTGTVSRDQVHSATGATGVVIE